MNSEGLVIKLLGQFRVRAGDATITFESARAESLLALLVLHQDRPLSRQEAAYQLWPDSAPAQALTNFRHVLHKLRHGLPEFERYVEVTPRIVCWRAEAACVVDVRQFEDAVRRGSWFEVVDMYDGDLLPGYAGEWIDVARARLREEFLGALEHAISVGEGSNDVSAAICCGERLRREEPLREQTYLSLMRLYDSRGDRALAVCVYHECVTILERELGVVPAAATRAAYDALLARDDVPARPPTRLGRLPLVGRAEQRAKLTAAWRAAERENPQLLLLVGEAGVGKTRLASEFRAWCAHRGAATASARAYPGRRGTRLRTDRRLGSFPDLLHPFAEPRPGALDRAGAVAPRIIGDGARCGAARAIARE